MTVTATDITDTAPVWGTFDGVRERLFGQFTDGRFAEDSGLPIEAVRQEVDRYLQGHADQPRVLQKAHVFDIIVTRAQIYVDPIDWFADKLNHGNVLRGLTLGSSDTEGGSHGLWLDEATRGPLAEGTAWFEQAREVGLASAPAAGLDLGHISPGWDNMLSGGLVGIVERSRAAREALGPAATEDQLAFYEAVELVCEATIRFAGRLSNLASEMVVDHPQQDLCAAGSSGPGRGASAPATSI